MMNAIFINCDNHYGIAYVACLTVNESRAIVDKWQEALVQAKHHWALFKVTCHWFASSSVHWMCWLPTKYVWRNQCVGSQHVTKWRHFWKNVLYFLEQVLYPWTCLSDLTLVFCRPWDLTILKSHIEVQGPLSLWFNIFFGILRGAILLPNPQLFLGLLGQLHYVRAFVAILDDGPKKPPVETNKPRNGSGWASHFFRISFQSFLFF